MQINNKTQQADKANVRLLLFQYLLQCLLLLYDHMNTWRKRIA